MSDLNILDLNQLIQFLVSNNEAIIGWLIIAIMVVGGSSLIIGTFFKPKKPITADQIAELEKRIKRVLTETPVTVGGTAAVAGTATATTPGEETAASSIEELSAIEGQQTNMQQLQADLVAKKGEIAKLQEDLKSAKAGGGGGGDAGGGDAELQAKVEELEARLAEYEIIEDDIADLSRYRDENEELKKQIEELKAGGGAAAAPAAEAADDVDPMASEEDLAAAILSAHEDKPEAEAPAEPVGEGEVSDEEIAEAMQATQEEPAAEAASTEPAAEAAPAAEEESKEDLADSIMNEFDQAVSEQKEAAPAEPAAEATPAEPAAEAAPVEPVAEEAAPEEPAAEVAAEAPAEPAQEEPAAEAAPAEELPAEAVAAVDGGEAVQAKAEVEVSGSDEEITEGAQDDIFSEFEDSSFDPEKLLSEAADMTEADGDVESSLDGDLDVDKMMSEAGEMNPEEKSGT